MILHHQMPDDAERPTHWDLMIEQNGELLTWALVQLPDGIRETNVGKRFHQSIDAIKLKNHRIAYLDYEGEVSGNRGRVSKYDEGFAVIHANTDNLLSAELRGRELTVGVEIVAKELDRDSNSDDQRCTASFFSTEELLERRNANP